MRNLMALLMTCEPEDVARIAEAWAVELPRAAKGQQAAALGREMLRDSSARRLWEALDQPGRWLAASFAEAPERKLSELAMARDDSALRACQRAGLLWAFEEAERAGGLPTLSLPPVPDPTLVLPPELSRLLGRLLALIGQGDTSGLALEESLGRLGTGELENLAAYWGLAAEPGSYTRDELVESLLGRLSNAPAEKVAAEAQAPARDLYAALVEAGGCAATTSLAEASGMSRSVLRDAVADLEDRLLALEYYDGGAGDGDGAWMLYLPQGPAHSLPGGGTGRTAPTPSAPPDRHTPPPEWAGAWDLLNVLRALELHDVPAERDGGLPPAFVSGFESALVTRPPDAPANLAWLHTAACELGLLERRDDSVKPVPRAAARWADMPLEAQAKQLLERWIEDGAPGETAPLRGAAGFRNDPETLRSARRALLSHLAACEPETWYRTADLLSLIEAERPHLLRPLNRLVRDLGSAGARTALADWRAVEGRWIADALSGPLAWQHVVEAASGEGGPFRLSRDGAWLAGRAPRPPSQGGPPSLEVADDGRVRVSSPDSRLLWALGGFAKPARANGRPLYLIDRRSVARARSVGIPPREIVEVLRRASGNRVPHELAGRIEEWGREPHRIRAESGLLVACESAAGVDELLSSPIVRSHKPRKVGDLEVLLSLARGDADEEARTLLRRLSRSGLFGLEESRGG